MIEKILEGKKVREIILKEEYASLSEEEWFEKIFGALSLYFGIKRNWNHSPIDFIRKNLYDYETDSYNKEEVVNLIGALEKAENKIYNIYDFLQSYREELEKYIRVRL